MGNLLLLKCMKPQKPFWNEFYDKSLAALWQGDPSLDLETVLSVVCDCFIPVYTQAAHLVCHFMALHSLQPHDLQSWQPQSVNQWDILSGRWECWWGYFLLFPKTNLISPGSPVWISSHVEWFASITSLGSWILPNHNHNQISHVEVQS